MEDSMGDSLSTSQFGRGSGFFRHPLSASEAAPSDNLLSSNPDHFSVHGRFMMNPSLAESTEEMHTHAVPELTPNMFLSSEETALELDDANGEEAQEDTRHAVASLSITKMETEPEPADAEFPESNAMQTTDVPISEVVDPICEDFMSRVEATAKLYAEAGAKQKGDFAGTWKTYQDEWFDIMCKRKIMSARSLNNMVQYVRQEIDYKVVESGLAFDFANNAKVAKPAVAMWLRTPIPCTPKEKKAVGPWRFRLVTVPGLQYEQTLTYRVRSAQSAYELTSAQLKNAVPPLPQSTASGALVYVPDGDYFEIPSLTFSSPSNGRAFEVEFTFTVPAAQKNYTAGLRSPPFTTASNINQWASGEGRYVAYLAFDEGRGPANSSSWTYFFNMLQFSHLTTTRQIVSPYAYTRLERQSTANLEYRKKARADPVSGRGQKLQKEIDLFESYESYSRVKRLLTEDEVRAMFPPRNDAHGNEVITYSDFCARWDWYGDFLYKLFTGQLSGGQPRTLWLDGLIHIVGPGATIAQKAAILDVNRHPVGTGLIRTSGEPGHLSFSAIIQGDNGPEIVSQSTDPSANDYATVLNGASRLKYLLNTHGRRVLKSTIIQQFLSEPPAEKEGYVSNL